MSDGFIPMNNPLSSLKLDVWYKVAIVICTIVFLSTAAGLLPKLPTNATLLISLGGVFFFCGEWKSHTRFNHLVPAYGKVWHGTGFRRSLSFPGVVLYLIGAYLIYRGIKIL
ncbi:hypothetical protein [Mixta mediterraneensis]|uniref:hypothetical protein n=1 Tax=Mixta mediterraneensis TaxID=2758443 RepID=UPI001873A8EF|nr:hypothetical protein [Mixta mediterraneensis]